MGNRTASQQGSSYSYQPFNRLVAANSSTFGSDANGNLTAKSDASGNWIYSWDYENRLKQASLSGGVTVTYFYDAMGRRTQRSSSAGGTMKFIYDGTDVTRDLDGGGSTITDYVNGPGNDNKLRQTGGGTASYFVTDHLGTTHILTDASGNITSSLSYDSFGNGTSGSASTRYTYTGRESDAETGLLYYRARWYDPGQGRFISEDPLGLAAGLNFYSYVGNSPTLYRDPSGLCPQNPATPQQQQPKPGCTQDKTGGDRGDIEDLLGRAGLSDDISNIQKAGPKNPEGITFQIGNRQAFVNTLNADPRFRHGTPFGGEHTGQVGGNIGNTLDYRSFTTARDTLGIDSHGFRRSLQVDVGPTGTIPGNSQGALGYADLDCDNPAQDVNSAFRHGVPIIFRRLGGLFRR